MIGSVVGPYRVDRELGAGGMGTVYAATLERAVAGLAAGSTVALKVVHPHLLQSPGFFKRFLREARIGQKVDHENVVRTFDFDAYEVDGETHHCLAMEYVEGQTLRDLLEELGSVPEDLCRHVGAEMAKGLAAIHAAGAVHRDIKPENVLITPDHVIKLMDLGVARLIDESVRLSQTGAFVGSVHYAAPEQFGGAGIDGRADLHALGITLFELATGRHPFDADELPDVIRRVLHDRPPRVCDEVEGVSSFFADVVDALVEKAADARVASADLLLRILGDGERSPWWRDRAQSLAADRARRVRRLSVRRETPVVGRDAQLATLEAAFGRARDGHGAVVLVEGEAGIGKSRLVDELVRRLLDRGEDLNFLCGGFTPAAGAGRDGVATAFSEFLGPGGAREHLPGMAVVAPSFDAFVRGETPPEGSPVLQPASVRTCFVRVLRSIAAERPTILLVDDLHFASQEALDLFLSLTLAVPDHPVLIIGTMRPGVSPQWLANVSVHAHVQRMDVARLVTGDLVQLLEASLRSRTLAEDLARLLSDKADGNPFFVFEMLRALRDDGRLVERSDGSWISSAVLGDIRVPASIADIVRGRLADLSEEERELLEIASCHGFRFDARLIAHALGQPALRVLQSLARVGRRLNLVRASGDRFEFDHHQIHEALYGELLDPLAREYHAMLAEALERTALGTRIGDDAAYALAEVDLCDQWARAGAGVRAHAFAERALEHLRSACRLADAAALVERLLAAVGPAPTGERCDVLMERMRLRRSRGVAIGDTSDIDEAIRIADALRDPERQASTRLRMTQMLWQQARYVAMLPPLDEAIGHAREAGDVCLEAACRASHARALLESGGDDRVVDQLESNIRLFEEHGRRAWLQLARDNLANYHKEHGDLEKARELFEGLLESALPLNLHSVLANLAYVAGRQKRYAESYELAARQRDRARETGDRLSEGIAERLMGRAAESFGRYDEAEAHFLRYRALAKEVGDVPGMGTACIVLSGLRERQGRILEAQELLEENLAIATSTGAIGARGFALCNLGRHHGRHGNYAAALQVFPEALECGQAIRQQALIMLASHGLSMLSIRLGRPAEAEPHLRRIDEIARAMGRPANRVQALSGLADCAEARGDHERSEELWLETAATHASLGNMRSHAFAIANLGRLRLRRGDEDGARPLFQQALEEARPFEQSDTLVYATSFLARIGDLAVPEAVKHLDRHVHRMDASIAMEAGLNLWHASGDASFVERAKRLLDSLIEEAPDEFRESMRTGVPVHGAVVAAWQQVHANGNGNGQAGAS